jgi:hypothetical protein
MSTTKETTTTYTIAPASLLGVAFVVLKLTHVINWSWWWVTVPFWGGAALLLGLAFFLFLVAVVAASLSR